MRSRAGIGPRCRREAVASAVLESPSCTRCSSSIATSPPPLAASVGPTHFFGWALVSSNSATGFRASSSRMIVTVCGLVGAVAHGLAPGEQVQVADQPALQGDVVELEGVRDLADGVERLVAVAVLGVVHLVAEAADVGEAGRRRSCRPRRVHHEVERAVGVVAVWPSISVPRSQLLLSVGRPLADAEDHELGWFDRSDADRGRSAGRCRGRSAASSSGRSARRYASSGLVADQGAVAPHAPAGSPTPSAGCCAQSSSLFGSKTAHCDALVDGVLEVDEQPAHVDVLPLGVGAHRPRAPHPVAAALEEAQAVHAFGVEHVLAAQC